MSFWFNTALAIARARALEDEMPFSPDCPHASLGKLERNWRPDISGRPQEIICARDGGECYTLDQGEPCPYREEDKK